MWECVRQVQYAAAGKKWLSEIYKSLNNFFFTKGAFEGGVDENGII